jgi:hypothetical protein
MYVHDAHLFIEKPSAFAFAAHEHTVMRIP